MNIAVAPLTSLVRLLLLILPWLYPFATGPSPGVRPWLFALACATFLWIGRRGLTPSQILYGWLLAGSISAVIGLLQYAGATQGLAPWVAAAAPGEAYGNLRQRNQFATLLNLGLTAGVWLMAMDGRGKPMRHAALLLSMALLGAANAASASRTGMAQLLILAVLAWWWGLWRKALPRQLLFTALLAYGVASLILPALANPQAAGEPSIWTRLREGNSTCGSRLTLWGNVLQLIAQRPWSGWGWGELGYAHFMAAYHGPRFCDILDNAHNLPLHLAVELGVPAALLLCGAASLFLLRARPWRETDAARQAAWTILALILFHSLLEYPLWYGPFQIAAGLCLWVLARGAGESPGPSGTAWRLTWEHGVAAALLMLTVYAQWDYHRISQIYLAPERRDAAYRENTLEKIRGSRLFATQVRFAEFSITDLRPENAAQLNAMAHELLHYSPEAGVVEKLIDSAILLQRSDEASLYQARYRAAFPIEYARWLAERDR